jgi:nucleoside 2-deoxyribosyltransferase
MKIYFACSITGGREFEAVYQQIVEALTGDGHIIPTSHLAQSESVDKERILSPRDVYERDVKWVEESDVLIAEVSTPSHGVGYEIGYALSIGKPVLCLYQNGVRVSKMITGNPAVRVLAYGTVTEAISQARKFLSEV